MLEGLRERASKKKGEEIYLILRSLFLREFLVFKILRVDKTEQGVAEQVRVIPVVESKRELIKVTVKVLNAHLMKRADYRTLEQRKHAFRRVGVNVPAYILILAVIHRLMLRVRVAASLTGFPLIRADARRV